MSKNMDQRVTVRLPGEIARALDKYCEDSYLDRSTVIRTALINWEPFKEYLFRENLPEIRKIKEGK